MPHTYTHVLHTCINAHTYKHTHLKTLPNNSSECLPYSPAPECTMVFHEGAEVLSPHTYSVCINNCSDTPGHVRLPASFGLSLPSRKILKNGSGKCVERLERAGGGPSIWSVTRPFVGPLFFPRLCIIQKSIHCVCLLCPAPNKPLFVPFTKANKLCVANKFQGLLDVMTDGNAVYILETMNWCWETMAERGPLS